VEDWNRETIFYGNYRSIFNHCDIIGLKICRIWWKKRKIRASTHSRSFRVIEVGTNRKPVCDFLLVINSNWHPISYRFGVIAAYCSNFGHFAFLSHPCDVHLGLIGKRVVDLLLVLIELSLLGVTAESIRAKRDWKSAISLQCIATWGRPSDASPFPL